MQNRCHKKEVNQRAQNILQAIATKRLGEKQRKAGVGCHTPHAIHRDIFRRA
jgi:hypothetical protein